MSETRRSFIKKILAVGGYFLTAAGGLLKPIPSAAAWPDKQFTAQKLAETIKHLVGKADLVESDRIKFKLPQIAENGAVVPITVFCKLDAVESISILVEKNPVPLIASFNLNPRIKPTVSARFKMAETSDVIAIVKSEGQFFTARRLVKVTIGGCGG